ncbi:unnamed protein product, partial [Ranitomeya imitator]
MTNLVEANIAPLLQTRRYLRPLLLTKMQ